MGGGLDVDGAFIFMIDRADSGDFVVLRASGDDAYNPYIFSLGKLRSVTTVLIKTRKGAYSNVVLRVLQSADAIFFAGGDQAVYMRRWRDTPLQRVVQERVAVHGAPVGGTSAGLAILGEYIYSADYDTVTSPEALQDPYDYRVTLLQRAFITLPALLHFITDTHFVTRDRMGRLLTFVARVLTDGWSSTVFGIGVDEHTAFLIDGESGKASMSGSGTAYVVYGGGEHGRPERCQARTPLQWTSIDVMRLNASNGDGFDFTSHTGTGLNYALDVDDGSIQQNPYGPSEIS